MSKKASPVRIKGKQNNRGYYLEFLKRNSGQPIILKNFEVLICNWLFYEDRVMEKYLKEQLERLRSADLADSGRKEILALFHRAENEFPLKDELFRQLVGFKDVIEEDEVLKLLMPYMNA